MLPRRRVFVVRGASPDGRFDEFLHVGWRAERPYKCSEGFRVDRTRFLVSLAESVAAGCFATPERRSQ